MGVSGGDKLASRYSFTMIGYYSNRCFYIYNNIFIKWNFSFPGNAWLHLM